MLKSSHKRRVSSPVIRITKLATAASLLFAFNAVATTAPAEHQAGVESATEVAMPLTLARAIALALDGNPELAVAKREVEATQAQIAQGQVWPNPELAYTQEDQRSPTRTQSLQINLPIEMGGKRAARISVAERARDIAFEQLNARRLEIRAAVVSAFFETMIAQERTALAQSSLNLARKATDAVAKRVAAGKLSPVEATKAQVAEAGVRVELAQAQSEQRSALVRFAYLLNANPSRHVLVVGNVDELPSLATFDSMQQRLPTSPTLRLAMLEVERRKAMTEVERSKRIPDVTVSLGVKRPDELQRDQLMFGISVPLPLFDRNQGNLKEALTREDKARDELHAATMRVTAEMLNARERLASVRTEVDTLQREVLPGAKSAYDAAGIGFENGKFSFLEVLDAQRTYFAAKSQYLKALAEAHRAAADIDRVLGETSPSAATPANKE
jgi:outer membrane protein, heavy metal efflux system